MRLASAALVVPAFFQTCLPNPPDPEPPVAVIETVCLTADCLVVELSAEASVDADSYQWFVDGVDFGTDPVFAMDLPSRGLAEVELVVTNDVGSDDDIQYLFTTEVTNDTATPAANDIQAAVVSGATGCDTLAIISTVGGCFDLASGANLEHIASLSRAGGPAVLSTLEYDPNTDTLVSQGFAVGVVWERANGVQQSAPSCLPRAGAAQCGSYGSAPYRAVVGSSQPHLTSYYALATGDAVTFDLGHGAYLGDDAKRPLDTLTLDCTTGSLQVTATPVDP